MQNTSRTHSFPVRPRTLNLESHFPQASHPDPKSNLTAEEANELVHFFNELTNYVSNVNTWATNESAFIQRQQERLIATYGPALRRFIAMQTDDPDEGVSLPAGHLHFVKCSSRLRVDDEALALEWCREHCKMAVDVAITLNGSFDRVLTDFMRRTFPFYLEHGTELTREVNLRRLQYEWREMGGDFTPPGCSLEPARYILCVDNHGRNDEPKGGDDDY